MRLHRATKGSDHLDPPSREVAPLETYTSAALCAGSICHKLYRSTVECFTNFLVAKRFSEFACQILAARSHKHCAYRSCTNGGTQAARCVRHTVRDTHCTAHGVQETARTVCQETARSSPKHRAHFEYAMINICWCSTSHVRRSPMDGLFASGRAAARTAGRLLMS